MFAAEKPKPQVKISDLCDADKSKIAKLIQQVVSLEEEKQQKQQENADAKEKCEKYEARLGKLKKQNDDIIHETANLRSKFNQSIGLLRSYQDKISKLQANGLSCGNSRTGMFDVHCSGPLQNSHVNGVMKKPYGDNTQLQGTPSETELLSRFEQLKKMDSNQGFAFLGPSGQNDYSQRNPPLQESYVQLELRHSQEISKLKSELEAKHAEELAAELRELQEKCDQARDEALLDLRQKCHQKLSQERQEWNKGTR